MVACGISMYSYIYIIAPHLGTLAETREGQDVEPNPKMVFGETILEIEVRSECHLTTTDLCRISGKLWSIIRLPTFQSKYYICVICIVTLHIGVG
jgi:hypothetical protein